MGLGASLVQALGARVPGLKTFTGIEGARIKLPRHSIDLLIWLRGEDRGELLRRSRALETLLALALPAKACAAAFPNGRAGSFCAFECIPYLLGYIRGPCLIKIKRY